MALIARIKCDVCCSMVSKVTNVSGDLLCSKCLAARRPRWGVTIEEWLKVMEG